MSIWERQKKVISKRYAADHEDVAITWGFSITTNKQPQWSDKAIICSLPKIFWQGFESRSFFPKAELSRISRFFFQLKDASSDMLRRRGSAPAVVLQQHFSDPRGFLVRADRIIPPADVPKLSKAKRSGKKDFERGCSPPPLTLIDRKTNDTTQASDYDSPSPKCPSPGSPGSPNLNKKPMKHRTKRRDSEPFTAQVPITSANSRNTTSSLHRRSSSFRDYNIVILGQGGVGKSGKFIKSNFFTETKSTYAIKIVWYRFLTW